MERWGWKVFKYKENKNRQAMDINCWDSRKSVLEGKAPNRVQHLRSETIIIIIRIRRRRRRRRNKTKTKLLGRICLSIPSNPSSLTLPITVQNFCYQSRLYFIELVLHYIYWVQTPPHVTHIQTGGSKSRIHIEYAWHEIYIPLNTIFMANSSICSLRIYE